MGKGFGDPLRPFSLEGRFAVVTGAAQGFGRAIVEHLLELGAAVLAVDLRPGEWIAELSALGVRGVTADVSDPSDVALVFAGIHETGLVADVLVNNAGIFSNFLVGGLHTDEFIRVQRVNVLGQYLCARAFASQDFGPRRSPRPTIVQIASVDAERPSAAGLVHYTTSKHAVAGVVGALAAEVADSGVRCNVVCPGAAMTEGAMELVLAGAPQGIDVVAQWDGIVERTPLQHLTHPRDVAHLVGFLASSAAESINGQQLAVDGGMLVSPLEGYVPATITDGESTP